MARLYEARARLFEEFSSNLSLYEPENTGYFKCPVCFELFSPESLISRPNQNAIIVAHVIPRSFLNAGHTLCCIKCDGKFGSTLASAERILRHNMRIAKWNNRPYNVGTKLKTPKGDINVFTQITWSETGNPIPSFREVDLPRDIPLEWYEAQWQSFTTRGQDGLPDDFTLWESYMYDKRNKYANLNWWHSYYLFMFHHFGYKWIAEDKTAALVRKQLLNLEEDIIPDILVTPQVIQVDAPYEAPPHNHLPIRPSLRLGKDEFNNIIEDGYYIVFPKLHENMNNVTLFIPWEMETCISRPVPKKFTERLKYGHSVLKYKIPDVIDKDVVYLH